MLLLLLRCVLCSCRPASSKLSGVQGLILVARVHVMFARLKRLSLPYSLRAVVVCVRVSLAEQVHESIRNFLTLTWRLAYSRLSLSLESGAVIESLASVRMTCSVGRGRWAQLSVKGDALDSKKV